jgi:hypothetical protein
LHQVHDRLPEAVATVDDRLGRIMPPYHRTEGLVRVAPAWRGKPVLTAEQIEDVVAFLTTLKN